MFEEYRIFKNVIGDSTTLIFSPLKVNGKIVYESFIAANHFNKYFTFIAGSILKDIPHGASYVPSEGFTTFLASKLNNKCKFYISYITPDISVHKKRYERAKGSGP